MQTLREYLEYEKMCNNDRWSDDVKRIIAVFKKKDILLSYPEARDIWDSYRDYCYASWMSLPEDDDELFNTIIDYVKENWGYIDD